MPLQFSDPGRVWRFGFRPAPWEWTDWRYASNGRFTGRWDDSLGDFRTVYAGTTLLACLIEVLAPLRRDAVLGAALAGIDDDPVYPHRPASSVGYSLLERRVASSADLHGRFCEVTAPDSLAELYPRFAPQAVREGFTDFDAATLRAGGSAGRNLTQSVATWLYDLVDPDIAGVAFESRHGDRLALWAIFERHDGGSTSPLLSNIEPAELTSDSPEILEAFALLGLTWEST